MDCDKAGCRGEVVEKSEAVNNGCFVTVIKWLSSLSFTISFRFSYFSVKERIGGQLF